MRSIRIRSLLVAAAGLALLAGPAAADRPTCEDLLSARALGQSDEQIAASFRTTTVRVAACARVAEQHERLDANRQHLEAAREQRVAR
ncbi:hypothetical protein KF840_03025 [bacterium]|nr:hypothetical protein [bacterium]